MKKYERKKNSTKIVYVCVKSYERHYRNACPQFSAFIRFTINLHRTQPDRLVC